MRSTRRSLGRLALVGIGLAAFAALAAVPAGAQSSTQSACPAGAPVLQLADPNPGDVLSTGDVIISGVAFDPAATDGSDGISRVDLFLGNRDQGGLIVGSVVPTGRTFSVRATLPNSANGGRDFVAYAESALSGQETSVSVPVFIGAAPTPTPVTSNSPAPTPLKETVDSTCHGGAAAVAPVSTGNPAPVSPLAVPANPGLPVLQLANPSSGSLLAAGDTFIQGMAYDPAATDGSGIDRVDLFLDSRDSGGLLLGTGVPGTNATNPRFFNVKVTVPSSANGQHSLVAYAHSSITGQETVVSVDNVFFGVAPAPTPRPTSS